jgi:YggT family protein
MGSAYFLNPVLFILTTAFELYIIAIILRFLLQWVRADFYNPISQFLVKVTNPPLAPLRRLLPGFAGLDLAAILLALLIAMLEIALIRLIGGYAIGFVYLIAEGLAKIIQLFMGIYFFTIIIQVVLSWVNPGQYNPVTVLLYQINQPLLRPIRRLLPDAGGFDFSPLVALLLIQLSKMILLPPLHMIAIWGS